LSFKNLTVVDRKANNDYNLTLRERRLGYEIGASNEIFRENLRYKNASKESKSKILDELCQICGYNRKYAIWKLNQMPLKEEPRFRTKRKRKYDYEVLEIVEKVWKKAGYPWSVRLKEILRLWFPWIKKHYRFSSVNT